MEKIAIVNELDQIIGYEEKMMVHEKGILHRAFSVVIFNSKGEMLLQKRSIKKYHSPGEWTNACCSHQREDESIEEAAIRRLYEELKLNGVSLKELFTFNYKCKFENGLWENEIDHVFLGEYEGEVEEFNKEEIDEVEWIKLEKLYQQINDSPDDFTFWFKILMERFHSYYK